MDPIEGIAMPPALSQHCQRIAPVDSGQVSHDIRIGVPVGLLLERAAGLRQRNVDEAQARQPWIRQPVKRLEGDPSVSRELSPGDRNHSEAAGLDHVLAVCVGGGVGAQWQHAQAGERKAHRAGASHVGR
jgi:hypothetical protein